MSEKLVVMPSNNTGAVVRDLADRFPGRLAHLISPGGWRQPLLPYALDNGAFGAFIKQQPFDGEAFLGLLDKARIHEQLYLDKLPGRKTPMWVAVPDVVQDAKATLASWDEWVPKLKPYGWPLAFVVQDGMKPEDVPGKADVVFVGGSVEWKWATVSRWAGYFDRVHVGRVNSPARLEELEDMGVESCDGTGWFRGDQDQLNGLIAFLAGKRKQRQMTLFECYPDEDLWAKEAPF